MHVSNEQRDDMSESIDRSSALANRIIVGLAPVRISFSGGGTDFSSYYEKFEGRVVSATITRYVCVELSDRTDDMVQIRSDDFSRELQFKRHELPPPRPPFEIALIAMRELAANCRGLDMSITSEVPPGSGLGGSGTVAVDLVNVLASHSSKKFSRREIAEKAYEIGHDHLGFPIGKQDEYAAAFGGVNEFIFTQDEVQVRPLRTDPELVSEMESSLMLFYLCETRDASDILKEQESRTREGDPIIMDALHKSREYAIETRKVLESGDMREFGRLLDSSWEQKKRYAGRVTNPRVDMIYRTALQSGAYGGKLTGAGGAGHMLLCCAPNLQPRVARSLSNMGLKRINFQLENEGASVREIGNAAN